jgi:hypothetical protein
MCAPKDDHRPTKQEIASWPPNVRKLERQKCEESLEPLRKLLAPAANGSHEGPIRDLFGFL